MSPGNRQGSKKAPRRRGDQPPEAAAGADAAERGRAVAVHADRRLRLPVRLPYGRAGRAGRRDRLAVRPALSTRRACSARCSTAAPARSGSARSGSTCRAAGSTSRGRTSLVTAWKTPSGWAMVRDALTMGPRRGEDTVTPHTRPPADEDADHMLVRTVACIEGSVEIELVCEPVFDYGRSPGEWTLVRAIAIAPRPPAPIRRSAPDRHAARDRGRPRPGPARAAGRARSVYCALSWGEDARAPTDRRGSQRAARGHHDVLARLARRGRASPTTSSGR